MDRFIVDGYTTVPYWQGYLKSNMDRFIEIITLKRGQH